MCNGESRVYAACFLTGHVAVLSSETQSRVALERVGANPQALSGMGEVLLCADDQARLLWRLNAQTLKEVGEAVSIGAIPIHVATSGSQIYVTNAASSTLQVIDSRTWQTRAELNFGRNTYPQAFVRVGEYGFVPLYGNLFADTQPGQRLVRLNLSNPDALVREGEADFSNLDLHSYAGITSPRPMPYDVLHHQGALYVALNNLDEETCAAGYCVPAGPGLVAKVDPYTLHTSTLLLGDECLNAVSLTSNGKLLVASCAGSWRQGEEGRGSGLALMEGDEVKSRWVAPSGFYPGVMASKCDELWVANANGGDVYLFSTEGGRLRLLRGTDSSGASGSEGGPMATCPLVLRGKAEVATVQSLWLKP
ncbi:MAG: hypothetical protein FWC18_04735 [Cystobacterineae bacterium]|jgi:DNA-binding beta-propeller fold protein YncE|nr:hypothetical protein [Cystobacterineae bacterium]